MKHVAAYLLAKLGGKENPTAKDIESILDSVGIAADKDSLNTLLKELEGKDVHELICAGREKMASVPTGGVAVAAGGGGPAAGGAAPAEEEKKEEEAQEESEDEVLVNHTHPFLTLPQDMGFSLFD